LRVEIAVVILSVLTLVAVAVLIARSRPKPDQSLLMLQQQLNAMQERLDAFGKTVADNLQSSSASMNTRLTTRPKSSAICAGGADPRSG
jgi:hypothetical protein